MSQDKPVLSRCQFCGHERILSPQADELLREIADYHRIHDGRAWISKKTMQGIDAYLAALPPSPEKP